MRGGLKEKCKRGGNERGERSFDAPLAHPQPALSTYRNDCPSHCAAPPSVSNPGDGPVVQSPQMLFHPLINDYFCLFLFSCHSVSNGAVLLWSQTFPQGIFTEYELTHIPQKNSLVSSLLVGPSSFSFSIRGP